jgi:hypothetical protein
MEMLGTLAVLEDHGVVVEVAALELQVTQKAQAQVVQAAQV